jgi:hypothetical protein
VVVALLQSVVDGAALRRKCGVAHASLGRQSLVDRIVAALQWVVDDELCLVSRIDPFQTVSSIDFVQRHLREVRGRPFEIP